MKTVNVENIEKRIDWINSILKNDSFKKYTLPAQLKALRFERDCLCKLLGLMENKNEFPNPVDGDVQALIERAESAEAKLAELESQEPIGYVSDNSAERASSGHLGYISNHQVAGLPGRYVYARPAPAQILRLVELPDCVDDLHGVGPVMSADAVVQALRQQGYEVKS